MKSLDSALTFNDYKRKIINALMLGLVMLAAALALYPLFSVFYFVFQKGISNLSIELITELPKPVGEPGGGVLNSILGSLKIVGLGSLIGVPVGLVAGIFLNEFKDSKTSHILRFCNDLLMGVPSIVIGIFIFTVIVKPMEGFSAYAGACALAIIVIPLVTRSTEEMLKTIPHHYREAGLALGLERWKVILYILVRARWGAILTGIVLSIARISGETAPLLFTSFNNQYASQSLSGPTSSLPVQIYTYSISPYEDWRQKAWAGALLLILFVLFVNLAVRIIFARVRELNR